MPRGNNEEVINGCGMRFVQKQTSVCSVNLCMPGVREAKRSVFASDTQQVEFILQFVNVRSMVILNSHLLPPTITALISALSIVRTAQHDFSRR